MPFVFLLQAAISVVVIGLALILPEGGFRRFRRCILWLHRVAVYPWMSICFVALVAIAASVGYGLVVGIPEPQGHDEYSYLLAADTFVRGRLTNPTHPMWVHFETFHVIHQPTYASKFFPAQGLVLAAGKIINGHPIVGVWVSVGLAYAGICWMLQAWLPRRWALVGTLIGILQVHLTTGSVMGYWSQSYWGGSIAALGGALLFGALPRIVRRPSIAHSFLFALGLAILANSRPYEGLVTCLLPLACLLVWLVRSHHLSRPVLIGRVVLPIISLLIVTAAAMGFYNYRVTGTPFRFPYVVHQATYMVAPLFVFQKITPPKTYNHDQIRNFHTEWELTPYLKQQSASGLLIETCKKLVVLWGFYLGPTLTIPFIFALPWIWRNKRMRFVLGACVLVLAALLVLNWVIAHYAAPITSLVLLLVVQSLRYLRLWSWRGKPVGRRLVYAIPCAFAASAIVIGGLQLKTYGPEWSKERKEQLALLNRQPGRHLVLVRYLTNKSRYHKSHAEWVYNEADIDNAKIVWAREMDSERNLKLLEYFRGREVWLLKYKESGPSELVRLTADTGL